MAVLMVEWLVGKLVAAKVDRTDSLLAAAMVLKLVGLDLKTESTTVE
jgi:hypothetical protein